MDDYDDEWEDLRTGILSVGWKTSVRKFRISTVRTQRLPEKYGIETPALSDKI